MTPASSSQPETGGARCARICLTPTRNESWIIRKFAAAAKSWADHIVVADQQSTDGTPAMLQNIPGIEVVNNDSPAYDESHRQRLLLGRARRVEGRRVLIGLDADEALSANAMSSPEWKKIEAARPGTVLRFRWINILPDFKHAWIPSEPSAFGFVDDGSPHSGSKIHSPRVPCPPNAPTLDLHDIVVLHFQYVAWERMASKQRWYQAWEYTKHRQKSPLDIFRQYNHMHGGWEPEELHPVKPEWLEGYDRAGIDFRTLACEPVTWWDREVVQMLAEHGPAHFRRIAIWNQDWNAVARRVGLERVNFRDPRSPLEKAAHRLLASTQRRRAEWTVRGFEKLLRATGW